MTLNLKDLNYENSLKNAKPTYIEKSLTGPPKGALGDISVVSPIIIPPINANISFEDNLQSFDDFYHKGLEDITEEKITKKF